MIILGIESSGAQASAAILKDGRVIAMEQGPFKVTHSETLMPLVARTFMMAGIDKEDIDAIAVSGGPGSFTGLRIGSATAKGLGMALNKPLIHVPTLHAMAYNFLGSGNIIVPIMDARRDQVYTGVFTFVIRPDQMIDFSVFKDSCAISITELVEYLNDLTGLDGNPPLVVFMGDGVEKYESTIDELAEFNYALAPDELNLQRADSIALMGFVYYFEGLLTDPDEEAPDYLRPSQAEREAAEKNNR
ncbi:MAG: tRNA (adenosine(37)-N6)-threonylcarbamoyltransferase complex dimerization subunit type 1 TsaB [Parasporobacterium sp.]|nr:tRNA (adenosine(37)-N6)-threonylcarbamoyltransferase complex dimerization subunit type 1 TsaB [Parasporobacterium sp.]